MAGSRGRGPAGWLERREKGNTHRTLCLWLLRPFPSPRAFLPHVSKGMVSVWLSLLLCRGVSGFPGSSSQPGMLQGEGEHGQLGTRRSLEPPCPSCFTPPPVSESSLCLMHDVHGFWLYLMGDTAKSRPIFFFF